MHGVSTEFGTARQRKREKGADPNALKVYLDHLLSVEGQHEWSKGAGFASLRRGVPRDHVLDILVPKEGVQYPEVSKERYVKMRRDVVGFARKLIQQ